MLTQSVTIVGAGQAGARLCALLRAAGFDGTLRLLGDEDAWPYERPPLSKAVLCGDAEPHDKPVIPAEAVGDLDVEWHPGTRVIDIDRHTRTLTVDTGRTMPFDTLVLATGSRPAIPAIAGLDPDHVSTLSSAREALALRRELTAAAGPVVIIGGGFIGLEVASSACSLGLNVTVVETTTTCMGRLLPAAAAARVMQVHRERGVVILTNRRVRQLDHLHDRSRLELDDGRSLEAAVTVVGVGAVPCTTIASGAGLSVNDGVLVDKACRSSDPHIFAIGDIARRPRGGAAATLRLESWQNAEFQAEIAACAITGRPLPAEEPPWFWTDQQGLNVQVLGFPLEGDNVVERRYDDSRSVEVFLGDDARPCGAVLFNAGRDRRHLAALLQRERIPDTAALADPDVPLRSLLDEH